MHGGEFGIIIDDVFTQQECREWIEATELAGYGTALINVGAENKLKWKMFEKALWLLSTQKKAPCSCGNKM